MSAPTIFWFRRDLRLADNPALRTAAKRGPVIALFSLDPALYERAGLPRLAALRCALVELDQQLGGALVIRSGNPVDVIPQLALEVEAPTIVATSDYGPYGQQRDVAVAAALAKVGRSIDFVGSPYAVAPGTVVTGGGTPYKVFTPFYRAWKAAGWSSPVEAPVVEWVQAVGSEPVPDGPEVAIELPTMSETAAHDRLQDFLDGPIFRYATDRDRPGVAGTSSLSTYLKWGLIHPRQILQQLGPDPSEEVFRSELAWRDFYADVLTARPDSARRAFVAKMGLIEVDDGPNTSERFDAWATGNTGFPIVDAGMRQLVSTGWMHNRVRMIVASFLVKDLHLDWTRGARFFMQHLLDGDVASNSHGWQWVAGTGTDASPYFRVFNPVTQGKKFDADGDYIRTWIPELAHLASRFIHEPWTDSHGAPAGYPAPIVDHGAERLESLARYERVKSRENYS